MREWGRRFRASESQVAEELERVGEIQDTVIIHIESFHATDLPAEKEGGEGFRHITEIQMTTAIRVTPQKRRRRGRAV